MAKHTTPSDVTRAEEAREAKKAHDAGRDATAEESAAAGKTGKKRVDDTTRESYEEMIERGARQQGEGKPGI